MADQLVGAAELANWLECTPRRLQQLVTEGVIERTSRGRYPVKRCVQQYCRYHDQLLMKTGVSSELNEEKLQMARLERRRRELEFAKLEGSLITQEHHERVLVIAFSLVRKNVRNLGGALSPRLVGLDHARDVERILVPALDTALRSVVIKGQSMAEEELPDDVPGRKALVLAGVTTITELMAVGDLTSIPGIGPRTRAGVLEWVGAR